MCWLGCKAGLVSVPRGIAYMYRCTDHGGVWTHDLIPNLVCFTGWHLIVCILLLPFALAFIIVALRLSIVDADITGISKRISVHPDDWRRDIRTVSAYHFLLPNEGKVFSGGFAALSIVGGELQRSCSAPRC